MILAVCFPVIRQVFSALISFSSIPVRNCCHNPDSPSPIRRKSLHFTAVRDTAYTHFNNQIARIKYTIIWWIMIRCYYKFLRFLSSLIAEPSHYSIHISTRDYLSQFFALGICQFLIPSWSYRPYRGCSFQKRNWYQITTMHVLVLVRV